MATLPATFPLPGATASGTSITLDVLVQRPTVIARNLADIAWQGFFVPQLYNTGVQLTGGALQYELPPSTATDVFATRDFERVAPGAPASILDSDRGTPTTTPAQTWAGKYLIDYEAQRRNDPLIFPRKQLQMGNTLQRKLHQVALGALDTSISGNSRTSAAHETLATATAIAGTSLAAIDNVLQGWVLAQSAADKELRNTKYDTTVIHPDTAYQIGLQKGFSGLDAAFASIGLKVIVSPLVTAGTAYLVESQKFGVMAFELQPTVDVIPDKLSRGTWVQLETAFAVAVIDPYKVVQITGL
jgi:hypothetical protein